MQVELDSFVAETGLNVEPVEHAIETIGFDVANHVNTMRHFFLLLLFILFHQFVGI